MRMHFPKLKHCLPVCTLLLAFDPSTARAQVIETVGSRALGMGGAFVAVASDSSATWWNPAGLAAGPFLDIALAHAVTETAGDLPVNRSQGSWFALGTPPFGVSYYALNTIDVQLLTPTVTESGSREDRRAGVAALSASQFGITLVHTVVEGLHAGATLKYVRGTLRGAVHVGELSPEDLLDLGEELEGGDADGTFDADLGVLGVAGPLRLGLVVRNVTEPEFDAAAGIARMPRQVRVGIAYDRAGAGGVPLTVAVDADVRTIDTALGERRNVAIGVERWLGGTRVGLRGGARFNMVGGNERTATGGISVAVRSGFFLDAHVVRGGAEDDRGWGLAARVSF
jgi:F plasmid transfer operon, TraF, protein